MSINTNYLEVLSKLNRAKTEIETLWYRGQQNHKTFEDERAYKIIENAIEEIEDANYRLKYYTLPTVEGTLKMAGNGKFELFDNNNHYVTYFSCGSPIEVLLYDEHEDETWFVGRVEYKSVDDIEGYYFYGYDKRFLHDGMRARVRQSD